MRITYEGIGIYVNDWSFAVIFMNFELGTILSRTYEGIGMFVDN